MPLITCLVFFKILTAGSAKQRNFNFKDTNKNTVTEFSKDTILSVPLEFRFQKNKPNACSVYVAVYLKAMFNKYWTKILGPKFSKFSCETL